MAKKVLDQRKIVREEVTDANLKTEEGEQIEDAGEGVSQPSQVAVSFHETTKEESPEEEEKPKSIAAKFAAATFNQGETEFYTPSFPQR